MLKKEHLVFKKEPYKQQQAQIAKELEHDAYPALSLRFAETALPHKMSRNARNLENTAKYKQNKFILTDSYFISCT